jgi:quercetin dioxygenase-like cupin family protein
MAKTQIKKSAQTAAEAITPNPGPIPVHRCDLLGEIEYLHREVAWIERTGPCRRTLVRTTKACIVLIAMRKKMSLRESWTAERISVQALTGHIRLWLRDSVVEIHTGELIVVDQGVASAVQAEEDSDFLLTLASFQENSSA